MYKAVAKLVLLYGSERWVGTGDMLKVSEGFHHWVARQNTDMTAEHWAGEAWEYPTMLTEMESTGLHLIGEYTRRQQESISEKVALRPIHEL